VNQVQGSCRKLDIQSNFARCQIASQGVSSQYAFYLTAAGTLHSLPTPVPRLNQKLTKPEWFESLRRSKIVQEQVNATRMWLCSAEGATQQSQAAIVTEFATVIPYCVPEGELISMEFCFCPIDWLSFAPRVHNVDIRVTAQSVYSIRRSSFSTGVYGNRRSRRSGRRLPGGGD
jgi:hypothetical protein